MTKILSYYKKNSDNIEQNNNKDVFIKMTLENYII